MVPDRPPWSLTIPTDLRLLALARAFIEAVCQAAGLDDGTTSAIVLACDEATNNVMRHGHQGDPNAQLQLQCYIHPDRLEIQIHDEGQPFDVTAVPHLDPSELRVGGRGVFLMRSIMDELTCESRGERGNTLRMIKRRGSTPSD